MPRDIDKLQAFGTILFTLCIAFGMFAAGYKLGHKDQQNDGYRIEAQPTHEGPIGGNMIKKC
jgi:hypothetical protein